MKKVIWSEEADRDYDDNIEWLLSEWGQKEAIAFTGCVESLLSKISKYPEMYPESRYKGIGTAVVVKQVSLLYRIVKGNIELVRFWNNYQNPENMPTR